MKDDYITKYSEQLHRFIIEFRLDRLESYSTVFKSISLLDLRIIRIVASSGEKSLIDIRDAIKIPNSTLSSAIKRLEKNGIIKRTKSPEDGRSYIIQLAEQGERVQEEHIKTSELIAKETMNKLENDQNREDFIRLIGILLGD